ncbi:hypothetical protein QUA03_25730 [Microcoleus sp. S36b_A4]|uniref:hypothetical protein n=1 Tax=Microcoleus sp. S36b_A4 TaxID=3055420 RepID=UPI002FD40F60
MNPGACILNAFGQLLLDRPLTAETPGRVRIIVLLPEPTEGLLNISPACYVAWVI